ncbi:MAG: DUF2125 domain-containing protein [Alphaproteobacteria bacterium]|nr:DUF2125 domain-containing protein [Alphaproteobacteria bacterium]MBV9694836.1 DUF2125 domain-containing protein [Alphaproteobacteria bacterium]
MTYSHRFFLYAPIALLLLLAAAAGIRWWFVARSFEQHLDALQRTEAVPGVTIRYAARRIGGFPFRLEAVLDDVRVSLVTGEGPVTWRGEHLAVHGLTYGRDQYIFEAAGHQSLEWGRGHRLDFETGSLHASAVRKAGKLVQFDLDLVDFGSSAFTAGRLQFHVRRTATSLDVAASAGNVLLSARLAGAFGNRTRLAAFDGTLTAPECFDHLLAGRADFREVLDTWRHHGGGLDAEHLEIDSATVDMTGQGRVTLDDAHRPSGFVDLKIAGMSDWLARNELERPTGFAAALRARAAAAGANEAGKMGAVLGARDGIVYLGDRPAGFVAPLY